jgi:hypothetical protein
MQDKFMRNWKSNNHKFPRLVEASKKANKLGFKLENSPFVVQSSQPASKVNVDDELLFARFNFRASQKSAAETNEWRFMGCVLMKLCCVVY